MPDFLKLVMIVGAHATEADAEEAERCLYEEEPFMVSSIMAPDADVDDCAKEMVNMNAQLFEKIKWYRDKSQQDRGCLILPSNLCGFPWMRIVMAVGAHPTLDDAKSGNNWLYEEQPFMTAVTMKPTAELSQYAQAMMVLDSALARKIREFRGKTYAGGGMETVH